MDNEIFPLCYCLSEASGRFALVEFVKNKINQEYIIDEKRNDLFSYLHFQRDSKNYVIFFRLCVEGEFHFYNERYQLFKLSVKDHFDFLEHYDENHELQTKEKLEFYLSSEKIEPKMKDSADNIIKFPSCEHFIEEIKFLLEKLFKRDFRRKYHFRLKVGKMIYHGSDTPRKFFSFWEHLHEIWKIPFDRKKMLRIYSNFRSDYTTINSLWWKYYIERPQNFKKTISVLCTNILNEASDYSDDLLAKIVYLFCRFRAAVVPDGKRKNKWWVFDTKTRSWKCNEDYIKIIITDEVKPSIEFLINCCKQQCDEIDDADDKENMREIIANLDEISKKLNSSIIIGRILTALRPKLLDEDFEKRFDTKTNLTGIKNGVLEAIEDKIIFRENDPEDFITVRANACYYKDKRNYDDEKIKFIFNWIEQVYVNKELVRFFFKLCSSFFISGNIDKKFFGWIGNTNASKSKLTNLIVETFGDDYATKITPTIFTCNDLQLGKAMPELVKLKNARVAFVDEANAAVELNDVLINRWTGGDKLFLRGLWDNGGVGKIGCTFIYVSNDTPRVRNPQEATRDRWVMIPHDSKWVKNPPKTKEEQLAKRLFKRDLKFGEKLPTMIDEFLYILTQYYPFYHKEGLEMTEEIREKSLSSWSSGDVYSNFKASRLMKIKNARIEKEDMYKNFKDFYKNQNTFSRAPSQVIFDKYFQNYVKLSKDGEYWIGYALKNITFN